MDVSIIIVNYNTILLILDCISSIKKYTKDIIYEIIIVDNDSNDDIEKIFKQTVLATMPFCDGADGKKRRRN